MTVKLSRREVIQAAGAVALAPSVAPTQPAPKQWPIVEGPDTPNVMVICIGAFLLS